MTRVVIAGASGLIGRQAAEMLAASGAEVHAFLRKSPEAKISGMVVHVGQGDEWPEMISTLTPDVAISCLGTTMRAAGSRDAFRAVDHDLVLAFAKAARDAGARRMISVSSVGAMPASSSFYLRTKADAEQGLRMMNFDRLDIIRPGLLTGGIRSDSRPGESLGIMLAPFTDMLMRGPLAKYRSTHAAKVAKAIVKLTECVGQGRFIHENDSIDALAG
jgi:uncharacterized protein YbjT (DUF2867 family)